MFVVWALLARGGMGEGEREGRAGTARRQAGRAAGALVRVLVERPRDALAPQVPAQGQGSPDGLDHGQRRFGPADVGRASAQVDHRGRVADHEAVAGREPAAQEPKATGAGLGLGTEAGAGGDPCSVDREGGAP